MSMACPPIMTSIQLFSLRALGLLFAAAVLSIVPLGGCGTFSGRSDDAGTALFRAEPDIRVRVRRGVESVDVDAPAEGGQVALTVQGSPTPAVLAAPVRLTSVSGAIVATPREGDPIEFPAGRVVEVLPPAATPASGDTPTAEAATPPPFASDLKLDTKPIPGTLILRPGSGTLDVIAHMGMETYLPGVVVGEMWAAWPLGAFQCQAVAARTYALSERDRARKLNQFFDVESTTADQVFVGAAKNPVAIEAVRSTRGMVVTDKGVLLKTYYSSTCGGRPGSASDVWPTGAGFEVNRASPLQGAPRDPYCQASPFFRWEVERSDDDIKARMRAWGVENGNAVRDIGRLRSVSVSRRNKALRPAEFKLVDDKGDTYTLRAEELRNSANFPVEGRDTITRDNRVPSGDVEVTRWADRVKFKGQGFGHGVGMCQWCAKGYADRGISWQEMLRRFYPGTKLTKGY